jgi:hypothetical protein
MSLLLLLAPSPVQSGYALSHVPTESHHRCDRRESLCVPHRRRLERSGKVEEWLPDQNRGAEKRKVATKVRSRLGVLNRDRVKIILFVK